MKRISTALVVTALLALGACGSRTANNTATADNVTNDVYDVAPDSLGANDLGSNASGNASSSGNSSSSSSGNSATSNASGNSH